MIGEVFEIEEIDEDGNPWIREWWRDEDGCCRSRSIALEPLRPDYSTSPVATRKAASTVPGRFDQLEKVTFRGTFEGTGTYGHLGGYRYQFNVHEVMAAARVWKLSGKETDAPSAVKASVCTR